MTLEGASSDLLPTPPPFGQRALDYIEARQGFPEALYERLFDARLVTPADRVVDLGTGTGEVALQLARRGCSVTGLDVSAPLLDGARRRAAEAGLAIDWRRVPAEQTGLPAASFDVVTAGQCWHWFDRTRAAEEAARLLVPGGRVVIAHIDWITDPGGPLDDTLAVVADFGAWPSRSALGHDGFYPRWAADLRGAGLVDIASATFDVTMTYTHDAWRRRMHASAALCALDEATLARFDLRYDARVASRHPGPLALPHRVFFITARKEANR